MAPIDGPYQTTRSSSASVDDTSARCSRFDRQAWRSSNGVIARAASSVGSVPVEVADAIPSSSRVTVAVNASGSVIAVAAVPSKYMR